MSGILDVLGNLGSLSTTAQSDVATVQYDLTVVFAVLIFEMFVMIILLSIIARKVG